MTTSNSYDFTQTRNEIISDALITLGVYRPGATIQNADYNICSNWLNKIAKSLGKRGIHMWTQAEGTLFLTEGQSKYTLSASSSDRAGTNCVETYLTADASGSSLTVSSTTGMTAADQIGIVLDDNTIQWTTIVSVNSATSLTITASLTGAASSGNPVYSYTNHVTFPINISGIRFRTSNGTDRPIKLLGREEFMLIPSKTITGKVNQACYVTDGTDAGHLYVWPTPDSVSDRIEFSYARRIQDFDTSTDNPDFPEEWLECLTLLLMARVASIYGKDRNDVAALIAEAERALLEMQLYDVDSGSIRIVPRDRDE